MQRRSLSALPGLLLGLAAPFLLLASFADGNAVSVAAAAELPVTVEAEQCEPEVLEEGPATEPADVSFDDDAEAEAAASPGYCGCENSGLGNICLPAFNNCKAGYKPRCTPLQGNCGVCKCV